MLDPLLTNQAQFISQKALSGGLVALLKAGSQTGTVLSSQENGKAIISFQGKPFPLQIKGLTLQQGQEVLAKLIDGRVSLQLLQSQGETHTPSSAGEGRSIANILSGLGLPQSHAAFVAQAFLQAGIPLDQTALKELVRLLPNLQSSHIATLSFLLGRGIEINPSILLYFFQILSPRPKPAQNTGKILDNLKKLKEDLDEEEEEIVPKDKKSELRKYHQLIQEQVIPLHRHNTPDFNQQLEDLLNKNLRTPEFDLVYGLKNQDTLGALLVKLLQLLFQLQPYLHDTRHAALLASLIQQATDLHQSSIASAVRNLPHQQGDAQPSLFLQIPIQDQEECKDLELLYQKKDKENKSGTLDIRLDLTRLGPMKVSFQWQHPKLSLHVVVTNEKVEQFLTAHLETLQTMLTQKGFHVMGLTVHVGNVPDTLEPDENTLPMPQSTPSLGLDVRA
jgi:hypothetical protein